MDRQERYEWAYKTAFDNGWRVTTLGDDETAQEARFHIAPFKATDLRFERTTDLTLEQLEVIVREIYRASVKK
jgi:hypothetical protein